MKPISWSNFPLPLIQVNPPDQETFNSIIEAAYENGVFSNSSLLQRRASSELARHVNLECTGYLASSNTMAMCACLMSVGVRGRHVLISNFTFAATLDAVIMAGGIPVVCDLDPQTLLIDNQAVSRILSTDSLDVAVVLPTRVFGYVTDLSELIEICDSFGKPVIVDAAATFPKEPGMWNFRKNALFEVFSFHATKVFGIGEAGFVVGNEEHIEKLRIRSNFGINPEEPLFFVDGLNAKADEFTAARALARNKEYSNDVRIRNEFVNLYKLIFSDYPQVRMISDGPETVYSYFPVIFETEEQLELFRIKLSPYILTRRYYYPTIFRGYKGDAQIVFDNNLQISESISSRTLCLPVYVSCTSEVRSNLARLIRDALESSL